MKTLVIWLWFVCIGMLSTTVQAQTDILLNGGVLQVFSGIVSVLKMKSVVVFSDYTGSLTSEIDKILDQSSVQRSNIDNVSSFEKNTVLHMNMITWYSTVEEIKGVLNFIVVCNDISATDIFKTVTEMNLNFGHIVLRHLSRWIFIFTNKFDSSKFEHFISDNIIIIYTEQKSAVTVTLELTRERKQMKRLLVLDETQLFPNMKYGLKETQLKVAAMEWATYTHERKQKDGTIDFVGVSREILTELASAFNFTYRFVMPADKSWGSQDEHGNWSGLMGMLQRNEVDICITPYAWTPDRSKVLEYGNFISYDEWIVIYKEEPMAPTNKWTFLVKSFKYEVYQYWALALLATLGLLLLFELCDSNLRQKKPFWATLLCAVTFTISIPLQQASPSLPSSGSGRMLLCFWWLLNIVMTSVYVGNMMASLTVSISEVPFSNLKELAADDTYTIGVFRDNQMEDILKTSNMKVYQDVWKKIKNEPQYPSLLDERKHHVELLSRGRHALFVNGLLGEEIMAEECDVKMMREVVLPLQSGFVFPVGSPLTDMFSKRIKVMMDTGLIEKWEKKWTPKRKICNIRTHVKAQSVDLNVMLSCVIVVSVGIGTAVTALSVEFAYNYFKKPIRPGR